MELSPNFLLYTSPNGEVRLDVYIQDETLWLTQKKMGELFGVDVRTISEHLRNIFNSAELSEDSVIRKIRITATDGKAYETQSYNLDAILSVGYRINSRQATQFRIWATQILREYVVKGFAMNDERLKNPVNVFGQDYFEEQLARIRDIRASERRVYQKITDIYAECSADYDPNSDVTKQFYSVVQNKLHYAITGKTAAEIIHERVDSSKPNMGLTTWKNAPRGKIRETDVVVAKNYLDSVEMDHLNRIVTMYLDYAEMQAKRGVVMEMMDWVTKLDAFLKFNEQDILTNAGRITHDVAAALALAEFEKYKTLVDRDRISDFDLAVKALLHKESR